MRRKRKIKKSFALLSPFPGLSYSLPVETSHRKDCQKKERRTRGALRDAWFISEPQRREAWEDENNKNLAAFSLVKLHSNDVRFIKSHQLETFLLSLARAKLDAERVQPSSTHKGSARFENNQNKKTLSFYNSSNTNTIVWWTISQFRPTFLLILAKSEGGENPRLMRRREERSGEEEESNFCWQQQDFSIFYGAFYFRMKQAIFSIRWNHFWLRCDLLGGGGQAGWCGTLR